MKDPIRLLQLEDNPIEAQLITALLGQVTRPRLLVSTVDTLARAVRQLREQSYDAILLDLSLPDSEGLESYRGIRAVAPELPVVVLTISDDEQLALATLQEGAQDYLLKGQVDGPLIARSVSYAIERQRLQAELREHIRGQTAYLELLREGFGRIRAGDLKVRLQDKAEPLPGQEGLTQLVENFDLTAEHLQHLNELKAQFFSMVTHDLRSPLNTILMATSALQDENQENQKRYGYVDIIRRKTTRILKLAEELLEIFYVESGKLRLIASEVELEELLDSCVNDLQPDAAARQQTLVFEHAVRLPKVVCDATKIQRVIENLVGNAIKYSVDGDTIRIRADRFMEDRVRVEVIDHGPGIPVEDHGRIFDLFCRGSASYRVRGSGLGLGICRAFVTAHGGRIWLFNQPGGGTRFAFDLPMQPSAD